MLISDVQHWPNNTTRIQTWKVDTFLQVRSVHVRKKKKNARQCSSRCSSRCVTSANEHTCQTDGYTKRAFRTLGASWCISLVIIFTNESRAGHINPLGSVWCMHMMNTTHPHTRVATCLAGCTAGEPRESTFKRLAIRAA